jgi:hypothetical protein
VSPEAHPIDHTVPRRSSGRLQRLQRFLWIGAALVFVLHALNYAYFFIDDEGIPFVTAQNVLDGKGFVYNPQDGPVEAYSDFLHVGVTTALLAVVRLSGADKATAFFFGKAISLLCGVGVIWLTRLLLARLGAGRGASLLVGLAFVALAGPLAVWSMSSLETMQFTFLVLLFVHGLCGESEGRAQVLTVVAGSLIILDRIDGFVFAGAIVTAFSLCSRRATRRTVLRRVLVPLTLIFASYHIWRILYYRQVLPPAVASKVLFKFTHGRTFVTRIPTEPYAIRFFNLFGWIPAIATISSMVLAIRTDVRRILSLALAVVVLSLYVSAVEDWMFGFRFFTSLVPLFAILTAWCIDRVATWNRAVAWTLAASTILVLGIAAVRFERSYEDAMRRPSWLAEPSRNVARYFPDGYYDLQRRLRDLAKPGDTISTNLAGFLPFMVGLPNVDNMGICTRVFAALPTTDVVFTEVGRYSSMTNKPVLRAADAYLMFRAPTFIIEPHNWIAGANDGIPDAIFDNRYDRLSREDEASPEVFVRRASLEDFQTRLDLYLQNLVHVSSVLDLRINRTRVPRERLLSEFPYLYEEQGSVSFRDPLTLNIRFAEADVPVYELYAQRLSSSSTTRITVTLNSTHGPVYHQVVDLLRDQDVSWHERLPKALPATSLTLEFAASVSDGSPLTTTVTLADLRVQGQTPELVDFISKALRSTAHSRRPFSLF